jgi:hypothetical protein
MHKIKRKKLWFIMSAHSVVRLLSPVNARGLREERALLERSLRGWSEKDNYFCRMNVFCGCLQLNEIWHRREHSIGKITNAIPTQVSNIN